MCSVHAFVQKRRLLADGLLVQQCVWLWMYECISWRSVGVYGLNKCHVLAMPGWRCVRILGTSCCCTSLQRLGGLLTSLCSLIFGAPAAGCHHWCGQAVQGVDSVRGPRLPARSGVVGHAFKVADAPFLPAVQRPDLYCFAAVQPAGWNWFAQRCAGPTGTNHEHSKLQSRPFRCTQRQVMPS